jgi:hypothetical protein
MSGSADLEDITITENGEYESVDHDGFGVVTVEVPTMEECAEEVAEILGVDTSQEWDCDDIKTKAQGVVDENEEMQECCDEVLDVIHDYDPTYDPHPVPPDPTNPTIPEKIQEIIDEESGYEFPPKPDGTYPTPPEIAELAGLDPITDTTTNVTLKFWMRVRVQEEFTPVPYEELITYFPITTKDVRGEDVYPNPPGGYPTRSTIVQVGITYTDVYGENIVVLNRNTRNREEYVSVDTYSLDPQTGTVYMKVAGYYASNPQNIIYTEDRYTNNSLIGYGDDTHPYKVTKSS